MWNNQPDWAGFLIGGILLLGVLALALRPIRHATRFLLYVEGTTVALILIVCAGGADQGDRRHRARRTPASRLNMFTVPDGVSPSILFLGVVFGFLSFAGFEAAATLGEEAKNPRRDIPRAILGVAIFGGVYFVFVTAVEMMGFGTDAQGVAAFGASSSLLGELGTKFVGSWVGTIITPGHGGQRVRLRAGVPGRLRAAAVRALPRRRGPEQPREGLRCPRRTRSGVDRRDDRHVRRDRGGRARVRRRSRSTRSSGPGVIGTLILLVVYILATIGAMKLLLFSGPAKVRPPGRS